GFRPWRSYDSSRLGVPVCRSGGVEARLRSDVLSGRSLAAESCRMTTLASGLDYIDLNFLGIPEIIATAVIQGAAGVTLVDPGPSTTHARLVSALEAKGIRLRDVRHVLLTHIHLDHAGVVGTLVEEQPGIEVFVHERGAKHMI